MGRTPPSAPPTAFPVALTALALLGALALSFFMWRELAALDAQLITHHDEHERLLDASADLIRINQTLAFLARRGATSDDAAWGERYDHALKDFLATLDDVKRLSRHPDAGDDTEIIRRIVVRIAALEHKALRLTALGAGEEARAVLDSDDYMRERSDLVLGLQSLSKRLHDESADGLAQAHHRADFLWHVAAVAVPALLVVSLLLAFLLRRSRMAVRQYAVLQEGAKREMADAVNTAVEELDHSKRLLEREIEVRKLTQADLAASEIKYRSLVEAAGAGFVILNEDGTVADANASYLAMAGRTELAEVTGRDPVEWTAGYDRSKYAEAFTELLSTGELHSLELDYMDDAGAIVPVEIQGALVEDGGERRVFALCRDVSKRRQADEELAASEERYRRLIEATGTAFVTVDQFGVVLDANEQYVTLTGHETMDEIVGRSVVEWTAEHEKAKNAAAVAQGFEQGFTKDLQVDYVMPDGGFVPIEVNATVVEGPDGPQIHALCRDISDRRQAEAELRNSEERLNLAFRGGGVGFFDWTIRTDAVRYNEQWAEMLGFALDEIRHDFAFWEARLHSDDKTAAVQAVEDHIAGRTEVFECEHRLRKKDGDWVWVLGEGRITERDGDGAPLRMTGVMIDITRRKENEFALAQSEERFRNVALTSGDWIWQVDAAGRYSYVSDSVLRILGYQPEELLGKHAFELMPPEEAERVRDVFVSSVKKRAPLVDLENWNLTSAGERVCMLTNGVPFYDEAGDFAGYFGTDKDITDRKRDEYQFKLFEKVFASTLEGITITDAEGTIIAVNRAFTEITGYGADEAVGVKPSVLKSDRHEDEFYARMWRSLIDDGKWEGEIWNRRKNGDAYPEWLSISAIRDDNGHTSHYVAVFHDISDSKQKEEQIEHQAYHDALTGLPNRLLLQDRLELALTRARRSGVGVAALFIDLDNFKAVNDSLGHAMGDKLLLEVAERFNDAVRDSDTVARLGGDEFVVLMDELAHDDDAVFLAERLIKCMEAPVVVDGNDLFTTPSIGIAVFPNDGDNAQDLVRNADIAMYQAKEQGRNRFNLFTESLNQQVQRRMGLERDMRAALTDGGFYLHYQPIVDVGAGKTAGVEALLRWDRNGEMVSPMEFIPLAEKNGLIGPLGEQVLDMALSECAPLLRDNSGLRLSVNISARQFLQPNLVEMLESKLHRHQVRPQRLTLEITESILLDDADDAIRKLEALERMKVSISVDDFGTGYSSLAYVKRLPVDALKVDRNFVAGLGTDQGDESIIRTIIQLAANFGMEVVAEGVETQEQLESLTLFGCTKIQGFYFSEPVPFAQLQEFIDANGVRPTL